MQIYNFEQGSDEWFQIRTGKITGSIMHDLLPTITKTGKTTYKAGRQNLLYKLAAERITQTRCDSDRFSNKHIERGNTLEAEARFSYEIKNQCIVDQVGFIELNKCVGVSPDGLIKKDGSIEIKCKDNHTFLKNKHLGIKAVENNYKTQIQFLLSVTGRKWCDYVCYNNKFKEPLLQIRIYRDETKIEEIKKEIDRANKDISKIILEIGGKKNE